MLLQLDQQLFHQPGDEVALSSLLLAVLVQEHTLLLRPSWRKGGAAPPWRAFLPAGQGAQMVALLEARLERSMEEAAERSSLNSRVVVRAQPKGPRELRLGEAARLAWMPLWLVLENGRNDLRTDLSGDGPTP